MLRWICTRRAFRIGTAIASAALALAIVTGAAAYITTDTQHLPVPHESVSPGDSPTASDTNIRERVEDIEEDPRSPSVDPNELTAADAATALEDQQEPHEAVLADALHTAEEVAAREADAARLAAEERQRAEAQLAAEAAAEAARVRAATQAAARAAAATPAPATPAATASPSASASAEATVARALVNGSGSIREAAAAAGWPAELLAKVERVVMCESSGRTTAVSPAGYVGLMQVAPWLHGPVPADPVGQLAQAYGVYLRQGWGAWPVCGR